MTATEWVTNTVDRLRIEAAKYSLSASDSRLMLDAADKIERLSERCDAYKGQVEAGAVEIERLRAALRPFSIMADQVDEWAKGADPNVTFSFDAGDLRRAREALSK